MSSRAERDVLSRPDLGNEKGRPDQRVALVTGCGKQSGIGAAVARRLSGQGAVVVVADAQPCGVANSTDDPTDPRSGGTPGLVAELREAGGIAMAVEGDISIDEDVQDMIRATVIAFGRMDILVNNAGAPQDDEFADIETAPVDAWDRVMRINLRGTFLMCRAAVGLMRRGGFGRIINVSSLAARTGYKKQAAYSASKAGVLGLTRSVAQDVARDNITVNAVCPGWIRTSRSYNSARRTNGDVEAELARRGGLIPVGRLGTPEDVAGVIAFLASEAAGYLTGQVYDVDGGLLMA